MPVQHFDFADCVTIALAKGGLVKSIYSFNKDFDAIEGGSSS
jgi:predicted nucleic acid-binding protein